MDGCALESSYPLCALLDSEEKHLEANRIEKEWSRSDFIQMLPSSGRIWQRHFASDFHICAQ